MGERRPIASFTTGDYDFPPATGDESRATFDNRLATFRRALEETREQARSGRETPASERRSSIRPLPRFPMDWPRSRHRAPRVALPGTEPAERPLFVDSEDLEEGRRRKRRKTQHAAQDAAFRYGHYGQVEAGRLRLHVDSCDGNVFDDRGSIFYGPENILKHDKSVYCTRTSRCNIILRHHDSSPFTLDKLHILAPENGFTAPLKEGLVYVAMDRNALLPYLCSDGAQHLAPPRSPPTFDQDDVPLNLLESLNDADISRALQQRRSAFLPPLYSIDLDPTSDDWATSADLEPRSVRIDATSCDEQAEARAGEDCPGFVLTDDEVCWPEDPSRPDVLEDRQRRERSMAYADDDNMYGWDARFNASHPRQARGRRNVSTREGCGEKPQVSLLDSVRNDNVTRARFQIKEGKHRVAIKFDPPISGTHILLKLQTPYVGKNIDIQTIIATGYAGPRYFPLDFVVHEIQE